MALLPAVASSSREAPSRSNGARRLSATRELNLTKYYFYSYTQDEHQRSDNSKAAGIISSRGCTSSSSCCWSPQQLNQIMPNNVIQREVSATRLNKKPQLRALHLKLNQQTGAQTTTTKQASNKHTTSDNLSLNSTTTSNSQTSSPTNCNYRHRAVSHGATRPPPPPPRRDPARDGSIKMQPIAALQCPVSNYQPHHLSLSPSRTFGDQADRDCSLANEISLVAPQQGNKAAGAIVGKNPRSLSTCETMASDGAAKTLIDDSFGLAGFYRADELNAHRIGAQLDRPKPSIEEQLKRLFEVDEEINIPSGRLGEDVSRSSDQRLVRNSREPAQMTQGTDVTRHQHLLPNGERISGTAAQALRPSCGSRMTPEDEMLVFMMVSRRAASLANTAAAKEARIFKWLQGCEHAATRVTNQCEIGLI